jgi:UDP-glucose 4-epimerase
MPGGVNGRLGLPVAVIGAGGFIGTPLVAALRARGVRVACFTRDTSLRRPGGQLASELTSAGVIFFLATSITPTTAENRPDLAETDLRVFTGLLSGLRAAAGRPTVILASSGGTVYDLGTPPPYQESSPVKPGAAYGRLKLKLEQVLLGHADVVHPLVVRLANIYGPGQPESAGVVANWLAAAAKGLPIRMLGHRESSRDYLYIDDTVDALIRSYQRCAVDGSGGPAILNVGSGIPVTLGELAAIVSSVVGRPLEVAQTAGRSFDRPAYWLDCGLAEQVLGWHATTPLSAGVARAWQSVRDRHEISSA